MHILYYKKQQAVNQCHPFSLQGQFLETVSEFSDLGVLMTSDFKFASHCSAVSRKAVQRAGHVWRVFRNSKNPDLLMRAFKTYVRPVLESSTCIWNPHYDKDIVIMERAQRLFTLWCAYKCFFVTPANRPLLYTYEQRCELFDLQSLEFRRLCFDLIMYFKILAGYVDVLEGDFFERNVGLRGHCMKLYVKPFWTLLAAQFSSQSYCLFQPAFRL